MSGLLSIEHLQKYFPLRSWRPWVAPRLVRAVDDVTLQIAAGETVGLVGESGCGKSTLARCVLRLVEPSHGSVRFGDLELTRLDDEELRRQRRDVQMVFQDPTASLNPRLSVGATVAEPIRLHTDLDPSARRMRTDEVLEEVGLGAALRDRYPHQLSGGQRQRVNIARAIATRPRFVVLDEPTSALDMSVQAQIVDLLRELQRRYTLAYLFISHDLKVIRALADEVLVMREGRIVERGLAAEIFQRPREPYTRALMAAAFELEAADGLTR